LQGDAGTDKAAGRLHDDLSTLLPLLRARDEGIQSIFLECEVETVSTVLGMDEVHVLREFVWGRSPAGKGIRVDERYFGKVNRIEADWDGRIRREVSNTEAELPTLRVDAPSRPEGTAFVTYDPDCFGAWAQFEFVADFLGRPDRGRTRVLGREGRQGRDCLKVVHDFNPPDSPDVLGRAVILWIDDKETLLVVEAAWPFPEPSSREDLGTEDKPWIEEIDGAPFVIYQRFGVLEAAPLENGVWFPKRCFHEARPRDAQGVYRAISHSLASVDHETIVLGDHELIESLYRIDPNRWYLVYDSSAGDETESYVLGPIGRTSIPTYKFYEAVQMEGRRRGLEVAPLVEGDVPFSSSSCGPCCLLYVAWVAGRAVSLQTLHEAIPPNEDPGEDTSLAGLACAAREIGLFAEAARLGKDDLVEFLDAPNHWAIVHLSERDGQTLDGHFALPTFGEHVELRTPPYAPSMLEDLEFRELWTGHAVLIGTEPLQLPSGARSGMAGAVARGGAAAAALAVLWWLTRTVRRRRRRVVSTRSRAGPASVGLAVLMCLLGASCGCSPADRSGIAAAALQAPALAAVGGDHYEAGDVQLGERVRAEFTIRNVSRRTLHLQSRRISCSCDNVQLAQEVLAPGDETQLFVETVAMLPGWRDAEARVEVLSEPASLGLSFHVSRVAIADPRHRLRVDPPHIQLGTFNAVEGTEATLRVVFSSEFCDGGPWPSLSLGSLVLPGADVQVMGTSEPKVKPGSRTHITDVRVLIAPGLAGAYGQYLKVRAEPPFAQLSQTVHVTGTAEACFRARPSILFSGIVANGEAIDGTVHVRPLGPSEEVTEGGPWTPTTSSVWLRAAWVRVPEEGRAEGVLRVSGVPPADAGTFEEWVSFEHCRALNARIPVVGRVQVRPD